MQLWRFNAVLGYFETESAPFDPPFISILTPATKAAGGITDPALQCFDVDGDGDVDCLIGNSLEAQTGAAAYTDKIRYFENVGGPETPALFVENAQANPFSGFSGLGDVSSGHCADFDLDGVPAPLMGYSPPTSCSDLRVAGHLKSGTYSIYSDGMYQSVYCDMETDGGGWTILAARTGRQGELGLTSDIPIAGDPLAFQYFNTGVGLKASLASESTETLLRRRAGAVKVPESNFSLAYIDGEVMSNRVHDGDVSTCEMVSSPAAADRWQSRSLHLKTKEAIAHINIVLDTVHHSASLGLQSISLYVCPDVIDPPSYNSQWIHLSLDLQQRCHRCNTGSDKHSVPAHFRHAFTAFCGGVTGQYLYVLRDSVHSVGNAASVAVNAPATDVQYGAASAGGHSPIHICEIEVYVEQRGFQAKSWIKIQGAAAFRNVDNSDSQADEGLVVHSDGSVSDNTMSLWYDKLQTTDFGLTEGSNAGASASYSHHFPLNDPPRRARPWSGGAGTQPSLSIPTGTSLNPSAATFVSSSTPSAQLKLKNAGAAFLDRSFVVQLWVKRTMDKRAETVMSYGDGTTIAQGFSISFDAADRTRFSFIGDDVVTSRGYPTTFRSGPDWTSQALAAQWRHWTIAYKLCRGDTDPADASTWPHFTNLNHFGTVFSSSTAFTSPLHTGATNEALLSQGGQGVSVDFVNPIVLTGYALHTYRGETNDGHTSCPRRWKWYGSNTVPSNVAEMDLLHEVADQDCSQTSPGRAYPGGALPGTIIVSGRGAGRTDASGRNAKSYRFYKWEFLENSQQNVGTDSAGNAETYGVTIRNAYYLGHRTVQDESGSLIPDTCKSVSGMPNRRIALNGVDQTVHGEGYARPDGTSSRDLDVSSAVSAAPSTDVLFGESFTGDLDDVRVWATELTQAILQSWDREVAPFDAGVVISITFSSVDDNTPARSNRDLEATLVNEDNKLIVSTHNPVLIDSTVTAATEAAPLTFQCATSGDQDAVACCLQHCIATPRCSSFAVVDPLAQTQIEFAQCSLKESYVNDGKVIKGLTNNPAGIHPILGDYVRQGSNDWFVTLRYTDKNSKHDRAAWGSSPSTTSSSASTMLMSNSASQGGTSWSAFSNVQMFAMSHDASPGSFKRKSNGELWTATFDDFGRVISIQSVSANEQFWRLDVAPPPVRFYDCTGQREFDAFVSHPASGGASLLLPVVPSGAAAAGVTKTDRFQSDSPLNAGGSSRHFDVSPAVETYEVEGMPIGTFATSSFSVTGHLKINAVTLGSAMGDFVFASSPGSAVGTEQPDVYVSVVEGPIDPTICPPQCQPTFQLRFVGMDAASTMPLFNVTCGTLNDGVWYFFAAVWNFKNKTASITCNSGTDCVCSSTTSSVASTLRDGGNSYVTLPRSCSDLLDSGITASGEQYIYMPPQSGGLFLNGTLASLIVLDSSASMPGLGGNMNFTAEFWVKQGKSTSNDFVLSSGQRSFGDDGGLGFVVGFANDDHRLYVDAVRPETGAMFTGISMAPWTRSSSRTALLSSSSNSAAVKIPGPHVTIRPSSSFPGFADSDFTIQTWVHRETPSYASEAARQCVMSHGTNMDGGFAVGFTHENQLSLDFAPPFTYGAANFDGVPSYAARLKLTPRDSSPPMPHFKGFVANTAGTEPSSFTFQWWVKRTRISMSEMLLSQIDSSGVAPAGLNVGFDSDNKFHMEFHSWDAKALELSPGATPTPGMSDAYFTIDFVEQSNLWSTSDFSLQFWCKRSRSGADEVVLSAGTLRTREALVVGFTSENTFTFGFFNDDAVSVDSFPSDTDVWHHWTVTYTYSSHARAVYRDGIPIKIQGTGEAEESSGASTGHTSAPGSTLYVGKQWAWWRSPSEPAHFIGQLDDLRIWRKSLNAYEVAHNFDTINMTAIGSGDPDVLVHTYEDATTSSETVHRLSQILSESWAATKDPLPDVTKYFEPSDSVGMELPSAFAETYFGAGTPSNVSFQQWVHIDNTNAFQTWMSYGNNLDGGFQCGFVSSLHLQCDYLSTEYSTVFDTFSLQNTSFRTQRFTSSSATPSNQWFHWTVTLRTDDLGNPHHSVFANGLYDSDAFAAGSLNPSFQVTGRALELFFGSQFESGAAPINLHDPVRQWGRRFRGLADEFRFFSRVLPASEIAGNYNQQLYKATALEGLVICLNFDEGVEDVKTQLIGTDEATLQSDRVKHGTHVSASPSSIIASISRVSRTRSLSDGVKSIDSFDELETEVGIWHHWTVTYDWGISHDSNGRLIFRNGAPIPTVGTGIAFADGHAKDCPRSQVATETDVFFGQSADDSNLFRGSIDEMRLWMAALTTDQIASNWNQQVLSSSAPLLAVSLTFDNPSKLWFDYSGFNHQPSTSGIAVGADGFAENLRCPTSDELASIPVDESAFRYYRDGNDGCGDNVRKLSIDFATTPGVATGSGYRSMRTTSSFNDDEGRWVHWTVRYVRATKLLSVFRDGHQIELAMHERPSVDGDFVNGNTFIGRFGLYNALTAPSGDDFPLFGSLDEFRVWLSALTSHQISSSYFNRDVAGAVVSLQFDRIALGQDSSGHDNHASVGATALPLTTGHAHFLDGVALSGQAARMFSGSGSQRDFTVQAWMKRDSDNVEALILEGVCKIGHSNTGNNHFYFCNDASSRSVLCLCLCIFFVVLLTGLCDFDLRTYSQYPSAEYRFRQMCQPCSSQSEIPQ